MKIHLHIDRVILDAASAATPRPGVLGAALQADLAARLGNRPLPAGLQHASRRAGMVAPEGASGAGRSAALAPRIARAILTELDR